MEVSIKKPFLKDLMLREKGFHDPQFLQELRKCSDKKITIEKEVLETIAKVGDKLRTVELRKREVEKEIQKFNDNLYQITEECKAVGVKIGEIVEEIEKVTQELEEKKISHTKQMKDLTENNVLESQAKTITELKNENERLEEEVKKFSIKMLSFFVEMHNQVVTNLKEMEGIKANMTRRIMARQSEIVEKQKEVIEVLKSFDV